jgi:5-hydroxyisourate hydrolase
MAGGISIHAVDVSTATKAEGLWIEVLRTDGGVRQVLAEGAIGPDAVLAHPVTVGNGVRAGAHEAAFHVAAYYRRRGVALPQPPFLDVVIFPFHIVDDTEHVHLPFKFTPWGFSLFRGNP